MEGKKFCPFRKRITTYQNPESLTTEQLEEFCPCIEEDCMIYSKPCMRCGLCALPMSTVSSRDRIRR